MSNADEKDPKPPATAAPLVPRPVRRPFEPFRIHPSTRVLCSNGAEVGIVHRMQGTTAIKLRKDAAGVLHYIPLAWVARIDGSIHLDRPRDQAMREWSVAPPE